MTVARWQRLRLALRATPCASFHSLQSPPSAPRWGERVALCRQGIGQRGFAPKPNPQTKACRVFRGIKVKPLRGCFANLDPTAYPSLSKHCIKYTQNTGFVCLLRCLLNAYKRKKQVRAKFFVRKMRQTSGARSFQ